MARVPDELVEELDQIDSLVQANQAILDRLERDSPRLDAALQRNQREIRRKLARLIAG